MKPFGICGAARLGQNRSIVQGGGEFFTQSRSHFRRYFSIAGQGPRQRQHEKEIRSAGRQAFERFRIKMNHSIINNQGKLGCDGRARAAKKHMERPSERYDSGII